MTRSDVFEALLRERLIAIVRVDRQERAVPVAEALHAGGVACLEVALTTPGALEALAELRERVPDLLLGAGTVLSVADVEACARVGARFIVTPVTAPELVEAAHAHDMPIAVGAFTPTEIHVAHRAGADLIKLFPASALGPAYLRALRGPFPDLRIVPTGGVDRDNAGAWLEAGAAALAVGGGLTDRRAIADGRYDALTAHARGLLEAMAPFRSS